MAIVAIIGGLPKQLQQQLKNSGTPPSIAIVAISGIDFSEGLRVDFDLQPWNSMLGILA